MNNDLTVTLTPQEWDYIAQVLNLRPRGEVENLYTKMASQLQGQQKPLNFPPVETPNG